jgi:hypothetical protein
MKGERAGMEGKEKTVERKRVRKRDGKGEKKEGRKKPGK